ncbi:MAG: protein kinase [Planctomycetota bacterium]
MSDPQHSTDLNPEDDTPASLPGRADSSDRAPAMPGAKLFFESGERFADRYIIRERVGFGGNGAVFRATDSVRERDVAIKILLPLSSSDERARRRLLAEGRIATELSHPNIVNAYDVDESGPFVYVTMELLTGTTLRADMAKRQRTARPYSINEFHTIIGPLGSALEYAHRTVCHRDIKPENIFVCDDHTPKLLDFGLARSIADPGSIPSNAYSSLGYRAPEVGEDTQPSPLHDQYSLACVAYEMLVGRSPKGATVPPSSLRNGIPSTISKAVMKALSPDPDKRFRDVQSFSKALQAKPSSMPWVRSAAAIGLAAIIVAGFFFSTNWTTSAPSAEKEDLTPKQLVEKINTEQIDGQAAIKRIRAAERFRQQATELSAPIELTSPSAQIQYEHQRDWRLYAAANLESLPLWDDRENRIMQFETAFAAYQQAIPDEGQLDDERLNAMLDELQAAVSPLAELAEAVQIIESQAKHTAALQLIENRIMPIISESSDTARRATELMQQPDPETPYSLGVATSEMLAFANEHLLAAHANSQIASLAQTKAKAMDQYNKLKNLAQTPPATIDLAPALSEADALLNIANHAEQRADQRIAIRDYQALATLAATAAAGYKRDMSGRATVLATADDAGRVPIIEAVRNGDQIATSVYIAGDGSLDITNGKGETLLLVAIESGQSRLALDLIREGANINTRTLDGRTPLLLAIQANDHAIATALLEAEASITISREDGSTLIDFAVMNGNAKLAKKLRVAGDNPNLTSIENAAGIASAHQAVAANKTAYIDALVAVHGELGDLPKDRVPILVTAAEADAEELIQKLIDAGANPRVAGPGLDTPLHAAARKNATQAIRALVDAGAEIHVKNKFGITPIDAARISKSEESLALLKLLNQH